MTTAPTERRGSFFETWRLFSGGSRWWWGLSLFLPAAFAPMFARSPGGYFLSMAIIGIWFAGSTAMLEELAVNRLSFLTLVPQRIDCKWLVVAPNCVGAVLVAVLAVFGRMPAVSALPLLGCALWTVGTVRWLRPVSAVLAMPVLAVAPVAAWGAYQASGWGAAAAAALALGFGALAFQPPVVFDRASKPLPPRFRARRAAIVPARYEAVSRGRPERALWLRSAVRFLLVSTRESVGGFRVAKAVMLVMGAAFGLLQPVPGMALFVLIIVSVPSDSLVATYSFDKAEFLRPLPFTRGQRFVGGLLIPLLIMVAPLLSTIAYVDIDWINKNGLWRVFLPHGHEQTLSYLRDSVGATFLPEKWPASGLSKDLWPRLRPLLWLDLLRASALLMAYLFAGAHLRGSRRGVFASLSIGFAVQMITLFAAIKVSFGGMPRLPVPPVWFALLLAAIAVARFAWRARAVNRPEAVATGRSTSG